MREVKWNQVVHYLDILFTKLDWQELTPTIVSGLLEINSQLEGSIGIKPTERIHTIHTLRHQLEIIECLWVCLACNWWSQLPFSYFYHFWFYFKHYCLSLLFLAIITSTGLDACFGVINNNGIYDRIKITLQSLVVTGRSEFKVNNNLIGDAGTHD